MAVEMTDLLDEVGNMDATKVDRFISENASKPPADAKPANDTKTLAGEKPAAGQKDSAAKEPEKSSQEEPDRSEAKPQEDELEWFSRQDIREMVASLELGDNDLKGFEDEAEFLRAVRFADKRLSAEGRRYQEEQQKPPEGKPDEAPLKKEPETPAEKPRDAQGRFLSADQAPYKVALTKEYHDEEIVNEFSNMQSHFEKRVAALEAELRQERQRRAADENAAMEREFDRMVDALGYDDLFGKAETNKHGETAWTNRAELLKQTLDLIAAEMLRGKPFSLDPGKLRRAMNARFADYLEQRVRKSFSDKIRSQSRKRLGSGEASSSRPGAYNGPVEKDPELLAAYERIAKEAGERS